MGVVTAINFVISSPCKLQLVRSKLELKRDDLFTRTWDITKILLLSGEAGAALPKLKIQVVPSQHICMHFFFFQGSSSMLWPSLLDVKFLHARV